MTEFTIPKLTPGHVEELLRKHRDLVDLNHQQHDAKVASDRAHERTVEIQLFRAAADKAFIALMEESLIALFGHELIEQYKFAVQQDWESRGF